MKKSLSILKLLCIACITAMTTFISVSVFANSGPYKEPLAYYQAHLRSNVAFDVQKGTFSSNYNCLAYVLGVTSYTIWPWGQNNPTASEMTKVLKEFGYSATNNGSPNNPPKLIVYGSVSNVGHIAKVMTNGSSTESKWGALEIVFTHSLSPYNSSPGYGPAVQYYY
ncbi:DUF7689 domain-containing protein [Paenibacillus chitinolyticus]|uniref:DUF7689 domain-containing protein n=1 Tax=Paenibacillus chitinolyticus TaxID=79263 RepID=UPI003638C6EC